MIIKYNQIHYLTQTSSCCHQKATEQQKTPYFHCFDIHFLHWDSINFNREFKLWSKSSSSEMNHTEHLFRSKKKYFKWWKKWLDQKQWDKTKLLRITLQVWNILELYNKIFKLWIIHNASGFLWYSAALSFYMEKMNGIFYFCAICTCI